MFVTPGVVESCVGVLPASAVMVKHSFLLRGGLQELQDVCPLSKRGTHGTCGCRGWQIGPTVAAWFREVMSRKRVRLRDVYSVVP